MTALVRTASALIAACAAVACLLGWAPPAAAAGDAFSSAGKLQRTRRLVLRLSVVVRDPAGNRRIVRHQVTPRLKAPRSGARPRVRRMP